MRTYKKLEPFELEGLKKDLNILGVVDVGKLYSIDHGSASFHKKRYGVVNRFAGATRNKLFEYVTKSQKTNEELAKELECTEWAIIYIREHKVIPRVSKDLQWSLEAVLELEFMYLNIDFEEFKKYASVNKDQEVARKFVISLKQVEKFKKTLKIQDLNIKPITEYPEKKEKSVEKNYFKSERALARGLVKPVMSYKIKKANIQVCECGGNYIPTEKSPNKCLFCFALEKRKLSTR